MNTLGEFKYNNKALQQSFPPLPSPSPITIPVRCKVVTKIFMPWSDPEHRPLNSKTSTVRVQDFLDTIKLLVLTREPASFWRENEIAVVNVVILQRVFARVL